MDHVEPPSANPDWTLREGDVVIKGLTPYLIVGDVGVRREPHQVFQPLTVPRQQLPFLVLDAGLSVFRDEDSWFPRMVPRLQDPLVALRARIDGEAGTRSGRQAAPVGS